jgi:hypothetical protein
VPRSGNATRTTDRLRCGKRAEGAKAVEDICRGLGVSEPTFYLYGLLPVRKRSVD